MSDPPAEESAVTRPLTTIDWALAGTGVALGLAAMAVDHADEASSRNEL